MDEFTDAERERESLDNSAPIEPEPWLGPPERYLLTTFRRQPEGGLYDFNLRGWWLPAHPSAELRPVRVLERDRL